MLALIHGLSPAHRALADRVGAVTPAGPLAPTPGGTQYGAGAGSAAGAGSGFFFFGLAALAPRTPVAVPRAIRTLGATRWSGPPQPFLLLLERPG